jgi:hypothetical protein
MKVSKSLIQAILVGITLGSVSTSACSLLQVDDKEHTSDCPEGCSIDHSQENENNGHYNCPACGMG